MADVFISYSRDDRAAVRTLAGALQAEGYEVWWDHEIPPGATFDEVIDRELKAAKAVVAVWSPRSSASRWVREEADEALRTRRLVPVVIDGADVDVIPRGFKMVQAADLRGWRGEREAASFRTVADQVARLVGAPRQPSQPLETRTPVQPPPRRGGPFVLAALLGVAALGLVGGGGWYLFARAPAPIGAPVEISIEDQLWQKAQASGALDDLRAYLGAFPTGQYAADGQTLLRAFDARLWGETAAKNTQEAYESYIAQFPDGAHVNEAKQRIAVLMARDVLEPRLPGARPSGSFSIPEVFAKADRIEWKGVCPQIVRVQAGFRAVGDRPQTVKVQWVRSDGEVGPVETVTATPGERTEVSATWKLSASGWHWMGLRVLEPVKVESDKGEFAVLCANPGAPAPNLQPRPQTLDLPGLRATRETVAPANGSVNPDLARRLRDTQIQSTPSTPPPE